MKTVVKAISERRVIDGWGRETTFRRPMQITPGRHYLFQNGSIIRELKTQEELMADTAYSENTWLDMDYYEYYL